MFDTGLYLKDHDWSGQTMRWSLLLQANDLACGLEDRENRFKHLMASSIGHLSNKHLHLFSNSFGN